MNRLFTRSLIALCAITSLTPATSFARQEDAGKSDAPKAQSAVASKTATFATIASSDPQVKKATDAKSLDALKKMLDTDAAISGTVSAVFVPESGKLVILNFAEDHRLAATAVVRERDFAKFPVLRTLVGKKVLITGRVTDFKNKPQVEIAALSQIKIIKDNKE